MLSAKKKIVVIGFVLMYVLLFSVLGWILFFNTGFAFEEKQTTQGNMVVVKNISGRLIHQVTISTVSGGVQTTLSEIKDFAPLAETEIDLSKIASAQETLLLAQAPFYQTIQKPIVPKSGGKDIQFTFETPRIAFVGEKTRMSLEACNVSKAQKQVEVVLDYTQSEVEIEPQTARITIKQGECESQEFEVTPLAKGTTGINFNINGANLSEKIRKELKVE